MKEIDTEEWKLKVWWDAVRSRGSIVDTPAQPFTPAPSQTAEVAHPIPARVQAEALGKVRPFAPRRPVGT